LKNQPIIKLTGIISIAYSGLKKWWCEKIQIKLVSNLSIKNG